jgi:tRNA (mo5U34)-methyltransferase
VSSTTEAIESAGWYHTLELPGGVTTRGYYDLRGLPGRLPLPRSLEGMRCLDVATSNGFWAFEMERRGAAEVVAIDVGSRAAQDWQGPAPGDAPIATDADAFELARRALGSHVQWREQSVYDLDPAFIGEFDFVFIGSVLLHLRDPIRALAAVRSVCTGQLLSLEPYVVWLSLLRPRSPAASMWKGSGPRWETPNVAGHRHWLRSAGFTVESAGANVCQPFGALFPRAPRRLSRPYGQALLWWLVTRQLGVPSSWVLAR